MAGEKWHLRLSLSLSLSLSVDRVGWILKRTPKKSIPYTITTNIQHLPQKYIYIFICFLCPHWTSLVGTIHAHAWRKITITITINQVEPLLFFTSKKFAKNHHFRPRFDKSQCDALSCRVESGWSIFESVCFY